MEIKRGDIFMADLDPIIGSEQGGIRPVVVIQNNMGNKYSPTVIVAAITTRDKHAMPTHVKLTSPVLPKDSQVLLEQIRTIDKTRLLNYLGEISHEEMNCITEALRVSIDV